MRIGFDGISKSFRGFSGVLYGSTGLLLGVRFFKLRILWGFVRFHGFSRAFTGLCYTGFQSSMQGFGVDSGLVKRLLEGPLSLSS